MANVLVFAVGQVFAWLYLRSGRFWLGAGATVALWGAIDWWLVGRYVLGTPVAGQQLPVLVLQAMAFLTTASYLAAIIRRRVGAAQRPDRFREGITLLLSGQFEAADQTFRKLAWTDPWDPSAWIARGDASRRLGRVAAARRCYRRAASVDGKGQFADLVAHRTKLLSLLGATQVAAPPAAAGGMTIVPDAAATTASKSAAVISPPSGPLTDAAAANAKGSTRADRKGVRKAGSGS